MNELNKDIKLQTNRNKDENVHRFAVREELFERMRERQRQIEKKA